ncbi:MAG: hypothetical protein OEM63_05150 [Gammaproteobacteria bacterium]|nr:hypothetical protein [Gammaproteobacteria bacterium]
MSKSQSSLEDRVRHLERMNRLMAVAIAGATVLLLLGATTEPDVIRSHAFQLVDENENLRAELTTDDEATGLYIHDETGTVRIGIAHFSHGGSGVALHGPESKGAAVLYLKDKGSLRFFDADGDVTSQVPQSNE